MTKIDQENRFMVEAYSPFLDSELLESEAMDTEQAFEEEALQTPFFEEAVSTKRNCGCQHKEVEELDHFEEEVEEELEEEEEEADWMEEELEADYLEEELEESAVYVEAESSHPQFEGFLEEEAAEMVWRMRPPVRYQGKKVICWAAAVSSWTMVTPGVKKFKRTQSVIDHFRRKGVVSASGALRSVRGLKAIKREFGLEVKKLVGGGSMSFINIGSMLKDSHLLVVFRRPGARYLHMVVVFGVDRFNVCYMDPAINPKLSILDKVKQNRICRKIDLFGDGATEFWVFWQAKGTKEVLEEYEGYHEGFGERELPKKNVANFPTPGKYYQIKKGDNLLKVTGRAYGFPES